MNSASDRGDGEALLDSRVAEALGVARDIAHKELAAHVASAAGLPLPRGPAAVAALAAIPLAAHEPLLENPTMVHDQASAAHMVLGVAAISLGDATIRQALAELGPTSFDENVRGYIYEQLAPRLAEAGHLRLVGWRPAK